MIIHSYENTKRSDACIDYIRELKCLEKIERLILLPIPSTRDFKTVLGTNVCIYNLFDEFTVPCLVVVFADSK